MKKLLKCICLTLIAVLLCGSLSGCIALDEARQKQAFENPLTGDIQWNGTVYRLLPACDELQTDYVNAFAISITEPDTPVLVKDLFGNHAIVAQDGLFISGNGGVYCRIDRYDELATRIAHGFSPTGYGYDYYDFDEKGEYVHKFYRLTAEETAMVEQVLTTVTPQALPSNTSIYFDKSVQLELCTDDLLFRRFVTELCFDGQSYCLTNYKNETGQTLIYTIPEDGQKLAKKILDVSRFSK